MARKLYTKKEMAEFKARLNRYLKAMKNARKTGAELGMNMNDLEKTFTTSYQIIKHLQGIIHDQDLELNIKEIP